MDLALEGKAICVTGGSDGMGRALVERLAAESARVVFCARSAEQVAAISTALVDKGRDVVGVPADVTDPSDLERFITVALERWGRIDGLVNVAGRGAATPFSAITDEEWAYDIDLKVLAVVRLCRLVLPTMRAARSGSIINVVSTTAKAPPRNSLPSAATRAAEIAMTKAISREVAPDNVRVNAICIGSFEGGQNRRRAEAAGVTVAEFYARIGEHIPLGRPGKLSEFADLATFLLSERSSYVTGSAINLDGGISPAT